MLSRNFAILLCWGWIKRKENEETERAIKTDIKTDAPSVFVGLTVDWMEMDVMDASAADWLPRSTSMVTPGNAFDSPSGVLRNKLIGEIRSWDQCSPGGNAAPLLRVHPTDFQWTQEEHTCERTRQKGYKRGIIIKIKASIKEEKLMRCPRVMYNNEVITHEAHHT